MAFIATTDPSLATGAVLEMYERQQAHWGYVPNYAMTFSQQSSILFGYLHLNFSTFFFPIAPVCLGSTLYFHAVKGILR